MKISIIIAYYNRKKLLLKTLESIFKTKHNDYEIIIVDDCSNDKLILNNKKIKIIRIEKEEKKDRVNPVIPFNKGIKNATGDIIIIQNPESYHNGDILSYVETNLKEKHYIVFSVYNLNNKKANNQFFNLKNKNIQNMDENIKLKKGLLKWFHHPIYRKCYYHFCSAIYKKDLDIIGGFDEEYRKGYCFDDTDLVFKINNIAKYKICSPLPNKSPFIVNLYHSPAISTNCTNKNKNNPIKQKWLLNEKYYNNKVNSINKKFNYPRILHLYWHGVLSFLNYCTILSFKKYHPAWVINVYINENVNDEIKWKTPEQKKNIKVKNYFNEIKKLNNVNIIDISNIIKKMGMENYNFIHQSDVVRIYMLKEYGGVWSDFDIIYIKNIENILYNYNKDIIFKCYINKYRYYPVGFFVSNKNSSFFNDIYKKQILKKKRR